MADDQSIDTATNHPDQPALPENSAPDAPAPDAPEAPAPKRRGRPRKKAAATSDQVTSEAESAPAEEAPAPKRRGRPRKKAADAAAEADEKNTAVALEAAGEGDTAEAAPAEEAPAPKRRGRPRKKAVAQVEADQADAVPAEAAPEVASAEVAPVAIAAESAAPAPDASGEAASEGEAAEASSSKRRGRPRKKRGSEEAAQATQASEPEHAAPETAEAAPVSEGTESAEAVVAPAPEDTAAPEAPAATDASESNAPAQAADASDTAAAQSAAAEEKSERPGRFSRERDRRERPERPDRQRNKRNDRNGRHKKQAPAEPTLTREELEGLKVQELRAKAAEFEIAYVGLRKAELIDAIYEAAASAEGFRRVAGILEITGEGHGFVRSDHYSKGENDAYVPSYLIKACGLRKGDFIEGSTKPPAQGNTSKYPPLSVVTTINGQPVELAKLRPRFRDLTPIYPDERLVMETVQQQITGRVIDLVAPIGKGQRGLIVSPPKAGKTTILKHICQSISRNNPEVHLICLLVDERPEEVTDMERSIKGDVVASTFDMPAENHTRIAELVIERAKRLVEQGEDVVVVLDSITRLARAYNLAAPASGRILSGGVDSAALYPPKRFLGAARNIEGGGSLTILASALIDTGSKMDEVIFEEFKGTGNMELKLDRELADKRIFPAVDPVASGTRNEDLLIPAAQAPFVWGLRRVLANMNSPERAELSLVKGLKQTKNNEDFLIRSAKKAAQTDYME